MKDERPKITYLDGFGRPIVRGSSIGVRIVDERRKTEDYAS